MERKQTIDTDMYGLSYDRTSEIPTTEIESEEGGLWDMSRMGDRGLMKTAQKIMDRDEDQYPPRLIRLVDRVYVSREEDTFLSEEEFFPTGGHPYLSHMAQVFEQTRKSKKVIQDWLIAKKKEEEDAPKNPTAGWVTIRDATPKLTITPKQLQQRQTPARPKLKRAMYFKPVGNAKKRAKTSVWDPELIAQRSRWDETPNLPASMDYTPVVGGTDLATPSPDAID